MKLAIKRFRDGESYEESFDIASLKVTTLLSAFYEIKAKLDPTLTFEAGCRSGICGACGVLVNGREVLACCHTPRDGDTVEPLRHHTIQRDLKVDRSEAHRTLQTLFAPALHDQKNTLAEHGSHMNATKATPKDSEETEEIDISRHQDLFYPLCPVSPEEEERFRLQSDCILCNCCYSVCPVLDVNSGFPGPFALTRAWRYMADPRWNDRPPSAHEQTTGSLQQNPQLQGTEENSSRNRLLSDNSLALLDTIQKSGIWECTLCGECTAVCPQHIDPKNDIMRLRSESIKAGYTDPGFVPMDFGAGFGFDPG